MFTSHQHGKNAEYSLQQGVARHISKPNRGQGAAGEVQRGNIRINLKTRVNYGQFFGVRLIDKITHKMAPFFLGVVFNTTSLLHNKKLGTSLRFLLIEPGKLQLQ